ncbi:hypothetical protein PRIPAC_90961 [Pristionchus pacificus]|uniref:Uncharacterized protein n=1 Tax=Pristionchus pacificus TaxID=54126 RepID=A0A2A6B5J2_PRIPA|nr:hypothetical protein PRIPAC_90961 [Pristionchus pacificus]|eukprot:PDM61144.1 hypothetical protein PRIPAC_50586 [Pristionchus pacificus]
MWFLQFLVLPVTGEFIRFDYEKIDSGLLSNDLGEFLVCMETCKKSDRCSGIVFDVDVVTCIFKYDHIMEEAMTEWRACPAPKPFLSPENTATASTTPTTSTISIHEDSSSPGVTTAPSTKSISPTFETATSGTMSTVPPKTSVPEVNEVPTSITTNQASDSTATITSTTDSETTAISEPTTTTPEATTLTTTTTPKITTTTTEIETTRSSTEPTTTTTTTEPPPTTTTHALYLALKGRANSPVDCLDGQDRCNCDPGGNKDMKISMDDGTYYTAQSIYRNKTTNQWLIQGINSGSRTVIPLSKVTKLECMRLKDGRDFPSVQDQIYTFVIKNGQFSGRKVWCKKGFRSSDEPRLNDRNFPLLHASGSRGWYADVGPLRIGHIICK